MHDDGYPASSDGGNARKRRRGRGGASKLKDEQSTAPATNPDKSAKSAKTGAAHGMPPSSFRVDESATAYVTSSGIDSIFLYCSTPEVFVVSILIQRIYDVAMCAQKYHVSQFIPLAAFLAALSARRMRQCYIYYASDSVVPLPLSNAERAAGCSSMSYRDPAIVSSWRQYYDRAWDLGGIQWLLASEGTSTILESAVAPISEKLQGFIDDPTPGVAYDPLILGRCTVGGVGRLQFINMEAWTDSWGSIPSFVLCFMFESLVRGLTWLQACKACARTFYGSYSHSKTWSWQPMKTLYDYPMTGGMTQTLRQIRNVAPSWADWYDKIRSDPASLFAGFFGTGGYMEIMSKLVSDKGLTAFSFYQLPMGRSSFDSAYYGFCTVNSNWWTIPGGGEARFLSRVKVPIELVSNALQYPARWFLEFSDHLTDPVRGDLLFVANCRERVLDNQDVQPYYALIKRGQQTQIVRVHVLRGLLAAERRYSSRGARALEQDQNEDDVDR
jgi:hypothetical protein